MPTHPKRKKPNFFGESPAQTEMRLTCICGHLESDHREIGCRLYGYFNGTEQDRCACKEYVPRMKSEGGES